MKRIISTLLPVFALGLALTSHGLRATVIAYDSFDYTDDSNLAGLTGGTGWDATTNVGWTVNSNITSATIQSGALVLGNGTDSVLTAASTASNATRYLSSAYSGDSLFIKYTFSVGAGTTSNADRFYMTLLGSGNGGGWGNLEIGTGVNNSIASTNAGAVGDNRIAARVEGSSSNRLAASSPNPILDLTSYTVIVEFSKSVSGATNKYNTLRLWVNPTESDYSSATAKSLTYSTILYSINRINFSLDEVEAGDVFTVNEVMLATTWADVTAIPEPSTLSLLLGGSALGVVLLNRRRR
ncbi:MAG TPA: PEP-CTERM sorting domain-containing protein [Rariglobus sp.]